MPDEIIKKKFGRAVVYDEPRDIPFTVKITNEINAALKLEVAERVASENQPDPRLQFKPAQLGFEILRSWYLNKKVGISDVSELQSEILTLHKQIGVLKEKLANPAPDENLNSLILENEELKKQIVNLSYTSPNAVLLNQIENLKHDNLQLKAKNEKYKDSLKKIGESISKLSGYYFNRALSTLKDEIILIVTSL